MFSAVTGRAAVKFATWKLEQGATLGLLEQLMGSRTVASTILTATHLRSFNLCGLGLILLWSLSPIGSQAVLHILDAPLRPVSTVTNAGYFNLRQQSYAAPAATFKTQWFSGFSILLGASLTAPNAVKEGTMDLWGNPKIPMLSSDATPDSTGWVQIAQSSSAPLYSSLFGIPLSGIGIGNTTVSVESSYVTLTCDTKNTTSQSPTIAQPIRTDLISADGPYLSFENVSSTAPWAIGYSGQDIAADDGNGTLPYIYAQSCPDCLPSDYMDRSFDSGKFLYEEFDNVNNITFVYCTPSQVYVESQILCVKTSNSQVCEVVAQRPSQLPHMSTNVTYLSFKQVVLGITHLLANATPQLGFANPIQSYIYDPTSEIGIISGTSSILVANTPKANQQSSPLAQLPLQDFGDRFGQIINSFVHGSMWNATPYIAGAPFRGLTANLVGGNNASFVPAGTADLTAMIQNQTAAFTVPATLSNYMQSYQCSFAWVTVFLVCTLAMLASAIVGVVFSRKTAVPDYLGYVSSLAKESQYVRLPDGGANLDGMDRARLMKDLKVRLGNVSPVEGGGDVGRLALARMEDTVRVRKESVYV